MRSTLCSIALTLLFQGEVKEIRCNLVSTHPILVTAPGGMWSFETMDSLNHVPMPPLNHSMVLPDLHERLVAKHINSIPNFRDVGLTINSSCDVT